MSTKAKTLSYYVHRSHDDGRVGWVGPIRSSDQADREVAAWEEVGWHASKTQVTPETRAQVKAWEMSR